MIRAKFSPHRLYRELVDAIERECRVAEWRAGDVDLWPLASQDLFGDIFRQAGGESAAPPAHFAVRAAGTLATPLLNLWKSRRDPAHRLLSPYRADAVLLGDGVSLDRVDGAWRDRFAEPIAAALELQGRSCFMMQSGNLARLPWARPTYAANLVAARAAVAAALSKDSVFHLADHSAVVRLVERAGIAAPSLALERLARRARLVAAQAAAFDRIFRQVRPSIAFVVTYYAGLGHAFALACRRRGLLCVDLQHCPHDGSHRGYRWSTMPPQGYSTLPGLFWTWTDADAADIRRWSDRRSKRWHDAIGGGHPQIAALCSGEGERLWQVALGLTGDRRYEREILVALQPIGGKTHIWDALAKIIHSAPAGWRWWIRRHPASSVEQDRVYGRLLSLDRSNVVIGEAAQIALPALLGHMNALVSLASGAAAEAAMFGIPALFLDREACDAFPLLIARGEAEVVEVGALISAIATMTDQASRHRPTLTSIEDILRRIERLAKDYARLCGETAHEKVDRGARIIRESHPPRAVRRERLDRAS